MIDGHQFIIHKFIVVFSKGNSKLHFLDGFLIQENRTGFELEAWGQE
jgi:hypothetical protein